MKLDGKIAVSGRIDFELCDLNGGVLLRRSVQNMATQLGFDLFAARCYGTGISPISHIALGSDTTSPNAGDTLLGNELGRATLFDAQYASGIATLKAYFGVGEAVGLLGEAGLFNAGSGGLMSNRATFQPFTKDTSNVLTVTWRLQFMEP